MRPAVISDLVAFSRCSRHNFWVFHYTLANDEKSGLNMMLGQQIEQFWRKNGIWAVVEGHGYIGTVDMN